MNLQLRLLALALIPVALGLGWFWVDAAPSAGAATGAGAAPRWTSSQQCKQCHAQQYDEWYGSHHQIAYTNPEVRKLSDDFRNKDCQACHLPRPVAQTGFEKRTLPRSTRPLEGVGCLACHLGADGGIMARHDRPAAPCRPRANADFASARLCASCHNQHQTTDQWRQSTYPKAGKTCTTCHMPQGTHAFPGAHDRDMLQRAAVFDASIVAGKLRLSLQNVGAGHNFPTEERHRAVDMVYRYIPPDGDAGPWQRAWRFRQPYRDEPGENTQLPAGATKMVEVEIPAGITRIEARLWYRLRPFATDQDTDSTMLFERQLEVR